MRRFIKNVDQNMTRQYEVDEKNRGIGDVKCLQERSEQKTKRAKGKLRKTRSRGKKENKEIVFTLVKINVLLHLVKISFNIALHSKIL